MVQLFTQAPTTLMGCWRVFQFFDFVHEDLDLERQLIAVDGILIFLRCLCV